MRYQPDPGRELPCVPEVARVTGAGHQRAGGDGADAGDRLEPLAHFAAAMPLLDLAFEFSHLPIQFLEVLQQPVDQQPEAAWQVVAGIFDEQRDALVDVADALRNDQTELDQQTADLVCLGGARVDEALAGPCAATAPTAVRATSPARSACSAGPRPRRSASASSESFLLVLTYGLTNCGAISFTVCLDACSLRAQ